MAWHECVNGNFVLCFQVGEKRFRRSLKTSSKAIADDDVKQVEVNLRKLEKGDLTIPERADVVTFLLSSGRVAERVTICNTR